jgi:ABC-type multidrug transport system ATPase subunit
VRTEQPWLDLRGVGKDYRTRTILEGVNMSLPPGITLLLGENGTGKSTLVSILEGLSRATRGQVRVLGLDPWKEPEKVCRSVAFLAERPAFFGGPRVSDYLAQYARFRGTPTSLVFELIRSLRIVNLLSERSSSLSLGEAQLVSIAAALGGGIPFAVLDEPNAHIDPPRRQALATILRKQRDMGRSFLVTTHVVDELLPMADWLMVLRRGSLSVPVSLDVAYAEGSSLRVTLESRSPETLVEGLRRGHVVFQIKDGRISVENVSLRNVLHVLGSDAESIVGVSVYPTEFGTDEEDYS